MNQNLLPNVKSAIAACVLAGGRAERLGRRNKGLMPWPQPDSPPLVATVLERIIPQVGSVVISANADLPQFERFKFPVVQDPVAFDNTGPLAGVLACGEYSTADWLLVVTVDSPSLPFDLASRLKACDQSIAVAHDGARLQPLAMLIRRSLISDIREYLADGGRSAFGWLNRHKYCSVDFSDQPHAFINLNTYSDFNISER